MFSFFLSKTALQIYAVGILLSVGWYTYDSLVKEPIRVEVAKTTQCYKDFNISKELYDKALKDAGIFISQLAQKVVDINESMPKEVYRYRNQLNECNSTIKQMREEAVYEKVNLDDEFFYINLPFR